MLYRGDHAQNHTHTGVHDKAVLGSQPDGDKEAATPLHVGLRIYTANTVYRATSDRVHHPDNHYGNHGFHRALLLLFLLYHSRGPGDRGPALLPVAAGKRGHRRSVTTPQMLPAELVAVPLRALQLSAHIDTVRICALAQRKRSGTLGPDDIEKCRAAMRRSHTGRQAIIALAHDVVNRYNTLRSCPPNELPFASIGGPTPVHR